MEFIFAGLAILILLVPQTSAADSGENATNTQSETALTRLEARYVCMVNNQRYSKEQIPVVVEGNTYYGCCEMCKGMLKNDPKIRSAVDPVSGNVVDKATSVIGALPDGKVYYFQSEANFHKFKSDTVEE